jgi:hypothetical protein
MTKTPISLQDLRRRLYIKAKTEPSWRFWGLYVHVCKPETLREAYLLAKANDGAPGIDGVTFAAVEAGGVQEFLDQLRKELVERTYRPQGGTESGNPEGWRQDAPAFDSIRGCNRNCVNWVEQLQLIDDLRSQSITKHHRELIHHYIPSLSLGPAI